MREGWTPRPLGEVLRQVHRRVTVADINVVSFAGVRWYAGGVYHRVDQLASTVKTRVLNRIEERDVVYNRMWATRASFGVVDADADGCLVTNDFPVFRTTEDVLPSFVRLLFEWAPFQTAAAASATGTTERRRLNEKDFVKLCMPIPLLAEQRRIVDLIGALDDVTATEKAGAERVGELRKALLREFQDVAALAPRITLGELLARGGGSIKTGPFGTVLKAAEYSPVGTPVISTREVRHGFLRVSDKTPRVGSEVVSRLSGYTLEEGDIVFARKGAVDRSARVREHEAGYFLGSDGLRVRTALSSMGSQALALQFQTGAILDWLAINATGTIMKSLSQKILEQIPIGQVEETDQRRFVEQIAALDAVVARKVVLCAHLKALREHLLTDLLSGEHAIPESYDEVIREAS